MVEKLIILRHFYTILMYVTFLRFLFRLLFVELDGLTPPQSVMRRDEFLTATAVFKNAQLK